MGKGMKETVEVESCIRRFPWLIQMVKSRQFHKCCDQHKTKLRSFFCCDCMIPPLCPICLQINEHRDHLTIKAYRCSNQSGVTKETISKYMDTLGIQTFIINRDTIVYFNQRRAVRGDDNHRVRNNRVSHRCVVSESDLANASSLFCSVECKFRNALGPQLDELMENSSEDVVLEDSLEDVVEPVVKKKHRRKGIPYRSPFY